MINELVRSRQLERPRLGHHCNALCKRTQVDFTFARKIPRSGSKYSLRTLSATAFAGGRVAADGSPTNTINDSILSDVFGVTSVVCRTPDDGAPFVLPHAAWKNARLGE